MVKIFMRARKLHGKIITETRVGNLRKGRIKRILK